MDVYAKIIVKIIQAQEAIIGPVAVEQAEHVSNLTIDWKNTTVVVSGDQALVIDELVGKYKELFGQISVEVSKDAVGSLVGQLPENGLPQALK